MPVYKASKKTKDGRQFYYSVSYVRNGKQQRYASKYYKTKKEAEKAEALFILNNAQSKAEVSNITIDTLAAAYMQEKQPAIKPQSYLKLQQYLGHICSQLGSVKAEELDATIYEDFRAWIISNDWSVKYKNIINNYLKTLLSFAYRKYDINNRIPYKYGPITSPTEPVKEMQILTLDEFKQFVAAVPGADFIYKALFIVLFFSCCRIGELNALTFNDIDFANGTISINKAVSTKMRGNTSKYLILPPKTKSSIRTIPLPAIALEQLQIVYNYYSHFEGFSSSWYCFGGINPLAETTITKHKNSYCKAANVKQIRLHDFRHSGASYYAHLNCPVTALSKLLGHSTTYQTLATYSHYYITDLNQLMERVPNNL